MVSWFHVKAEQCGRMARNAVDPRQRSHFEAERELWLQIADSQRRQEERRNDEGLNAVAFAPDPSRPDPVKGLDLDDPEARRRFIEGET